MTHNSDAVDDLMQEVFLRVYPRAGTLEPSCWPKYCMRVARNLGIEYSRRNKRLEYRVIDSVCEQTPHHEYLTGERESLYERLYDAIDHLSFAQQQAVDIFLSDGHREDAAKAFGIPSSTLRARQKRAFYLLGRALR